MATVKGAPRRIDLTLIILALTLTVLGILLVFDASYNYALQMHHSPFRFVKQQALWGIIGVAAMLWVAYTPHWKWRSWGLYGIAVSGLLLVAVLIPHVGVVANGARRWLELGPVRLQPSELAKLAIVLYVARVCAKRFKSKKDYWSGWFPKLRIIGAVAALTYIEPDIGTSIVLFVGGLGALYFAGMKMRHVVATLAIVLVVAGLVLGFKSIRSHDRTAGPSFQVARLLVFLHPEQDKQGYGYQIYHSTIALGSGGLLGKGIGEGREKMYLPEAYTDFIFAVLGEEGGLIGTLIMLALLVALVGRGFHIAASTKDPHGALLAAGVSMMFGLQIFMNIGVVTSSIPATGVPLPLESYGGSSLVISLVMIGILLSVARFPSGDPAKLIDELDPKPDQDFDRRWNRGQTLSRPEYGQGRGYASSASHASAVRNRRR